MGKRINYYKKNAAIGLLGLLLAGTFSSCSDNADNVATVQHEAGQPLELTSFYPATGGAKCSILLDGKNFGTDVKDIKVFFNKKKAAIISSSGDRIYAIVPRLPGDDPVVKVVVGNDSATYDKPFHYVAQAQVTTVVGNGTKNYLEGPLDQAHVYGKYLELDGEGNLFMSWRDGGSWGVARISEKDHIMTTLYEAKSSSDRVLFANGLTVDRKTGILTASHESVPEVFFSFDPREAWNPRQRNAKFSESDYASIVWNDRYANFITFSSYDNHLYTRFRDGKVARIDPDTYEATIVAQGPYGSQYGQAINPKKPWELYITLHSNARPVEFRQGIMMMDLRHPERGFKRLNAPGGSAFRDGPIEDALFNYPKDIKFDNDGNMFIADYGNHCVRMLSSDGVVSTVAGQPGKAGYKDGGPVESQFNHPWGVAVNEQGEIYIADWGNARIRKLVIE
ncbi:MAG: IPT/TIG domain-containing protein [Prevotella sp.]